jgi:hypothetical protein
MRHRSQLSPVSDAHESQAAVPRGKEPLALWNTRDDVNFFRLCLFYDSTVKNVRPNWSAVLGLGLVTVISVSFWVGVGLVIARLW